MQNKQDKAGNRLLSIPSNVGIFCSISLLHFFVAIYYKQIKGLDIRLVTNPDTRVGWDSLWQTLPLDLIRFNFWESIWALHSQPPGYNLYGAFFIKSFYQNHLEYLHLSNIILGSCICGMLYIILLEFTRNKLLSILTALILALNPSLFLYESYILYTLLVSFLVTICVFMLALHSLNERRIYLYAFILCLNLLILTRSLYHPIILLAAIPIICILAGRNWRRIFIVSIIISSLSIGWYGKNYLKFGFFGSSSWAGISLWKMASTNYPKNKIKDLAKDGGINPVVAHTPPFRRPSTYQKFGFNQTSDIDALSRDDYNNINIIAISKLYRQSAIQLIFHNPGHYLKNIFRAYRNYSCPTSDFVDLVQNASKISVHEMISSEIIQGRRIARQLAGGWGVMDFCSYLFFLLPLSIILYLISILRECRFDKRRWVDYIQTNAAILFSAFIIFYTTVIGCTLEIGENGRFKFLIEPILWCFIVSVAYCYIKERRKVLKEKQPE